MNKKKSKLIEYIEATVKLQTYKQITGQFQSYNFNRLLALCVKHFRKYDELKFERVVQYYYNKEKKRQLSQTHRIKNNKHVLELQKKYELIDVTKLVQYLVFVNKISIKNSTEFKIVEDIIKINLSIPLFDKTSTLKNNENEEIDLHIKAKEQSEKIKIEIQNNKSKETEKGKINVKEFNN